VLDGLAEDRTSDSFHDQVEVTLDLLGDHIGAE
jgi:hypothetical protein